MTYEEFIQNILDTRGRFACGDEYHERHHILPKCMGGTNDEENLIDLYAREHFIVHRLLALENPNNDSLVYAWHMMSVINDNQQRYELTPEEYEEAKIAISKLKLGKSHSSETIKKLSDSAKERLNNPENHPMYGKHFTEESRKKMSESAKKRLKNPESHPMYGRYHTEESKAKLRESKKNISEKTRKKISEAAKERYKNPENSPRYGKGKHVIQLSLDGDYIAEYISANEAEKITGIKNSGIRQVCEHIRNRKTAGGFVWMYEEEYEQLNGINGGNKEK